MTRSPTRLLRRLFGEPPMLELPLGRLFRRAYVHAQHESGNLSGSDSVAIPGKQRAASPLYLDGRPTVTTSCELTTIVEIETGISALLLFSSAIWSGCLQRSLPGAARAADRSVDSFKQGLLLQWFPEAGN